MSYPVVDEIAIAILSLESRIDSRASERVFAIYSPGDGRGAPVSSKKIRRVKGTLDRTRRIHEAGRIVAWDCGNRGCLQQRAFERCFFIGETAVFVGMVRAVSNMIG
ncbi:MAG TPA: hypothetical protein VFE79_26250 [Paraburkholderia sp.]|jgi:hypothetical protein|nr:hypothetical protein [Paraburkholderia sp.]